MIYLAFLEKLVGKQQPSVDVEEFLNTLDEQEDDEYVDADAFVRPMTLNTESDRDLAIEEVKKGNFVLLNIADLSASIIAKTSSFPGSVSIIISCFIF